MIIKLLDSQKESITEISPVRLRCYDIVVLRNIPKRTNPHVEFIGFKGIISETKSGERYALCWKD